MKYKHKFGRCGLVYKSLLNGDDRFFQKFLIFGGDLWYLIGQVRVIHFEFDVETDTAISVAGEMMSELNLGEQDVIRIAEIIDAAIMAMLPEWRPSIGNKESLSNRDKLNLNTVSNNKLNLNTVSSEGSDVVVHSEHDPMTWVNLSEQGLELSPQTDHLIMHGRFEEVPEEHCSSPSLSAVDDDWDSDCQ